MSMHDPHIDPDSKINNRKKNLKKHAHLLEFSSLSLTFLTEID